MAKEKKSQMYAVSLDPTKCLSYTMPNGIKYVAGKVVNIPEEKLGPYKSAAVFNITKYVDRPPVAPKKAASVEVNPDDKGEKVKEEEKEEKPSGVISTNDLKK